MCGIVGVFGTVTQAEEKAFTDMLLFDVVRGPHATGVVVMEKFDKQVEVLKRAVNSIDFVESAEYQKLMRGQFCAILGHNRFATKGSINHQNAHPFVHGHITGVHNGTLRTQYNLQDHLRFEVDSDNLFYNISKEGVRETWKKMDGAAAIAWLDAKERTFNFARNHERPLCYAYTKNETCVFISSEPGILMAAAYRNGVKIGKVMDVDPNTLFFCELDDIKKKKKVPLFYAEKPLEKETFQYNRTVYTYRDNSETVRHHYTPPANTSKDTTWPHLRKYIGKFIVFEPLSKKYLNGFGLRGTVVSEKGLSVSTFMPVLFKDDLDDIKIYHGASTVKYIAQVLDVEWIEHSVVLKLDEDTLVTYEDEEQLKQIREQHEDKQVEKEPKPDTYKGRNGVEMTREEFVKAYPTCYFCKDHIYPEDGYEFVFGGTIMCKECAVKDDVATYGIM